MLMSETPKTILIIDDSLTFREALRAALEEVPYHVLTAENGADGLRLATAAHPDAIIVDGVLPDIDGVTLLEQIRAQAGPLPCLFLTGLDDAATEHAARAAGAGRFARKDEDLNGVVAQMRDLLHYQ
jgi:DNA-binding response OmpR family regulator